MRDTGDLFGCFLSGMALASVFGYLIWEHDKPTPAPAPYIPGHLEIIYHCEADSGTIQLGSLIQTIVDTDFGTNNIIFTVEQGSTE